MHNNPRCMGFGIWLRSENPLFPSSVAYQLFPSCPEDAIIAPRKFRRILIQENVEKVGCGVESCGDIRRCPLRRAIIRRR